jgi:hypothetical protein
MSSLHAHIECWTQANSTFHVSFTAAKPHRLIDMTVNHCSDAAVFAECITKYVPVSAFQN